MESDLPARRRIVVDGSNIATEGRNLPSLAQLDEAIRAFLEEYRGFTTSDVTVVVDASFGHRIDPSEVKAFEQALEHGEMITPPAGAVGRGDGFILRIAEKSGALVLSNDSFQEFHAERPWLFEPGRLIGGKPVTGVGWVFTPRTPVRGPKSRSVTAKSRRDAKDAEGPDSSEGQDELVTEEVDGAEPRSGAKATRASKGSRATKATRAAKAAPPDAEPVKAAKAGKATKATKTIKTTKAAKAAKATKATKATKAAKPTKMANAAGGDVPDEGATPAKAAKAAKAAKSVKASRATKSAGGDVAEEVPPRRRSKANAAPAKVDDGGTRSGPAPQALNDPMTFLTFVANHPVGGTVDGTVVSFTSHGAHIDVGGMLCHVPLRGLGNPAPQKARQVLAKGETRPFVLMSLDAARRRAELFLPGVKE